tara:strand:+ start:689 stop:925 length:237 start_codon:yes stop_codon:yes gene_type:complete
LEGVKMTEENTEVKTIKIDDKDYPVDDLSQKAVQAITQLQLISNKRNNLMAELDIINVAQAQYSNTLKTELESNKKDE